jgi:outer membrane murein-binding lipoprotein Lpp
VLGLNPWVILAVVLGLLGAFGGGYWRGHRAADKSAKVETQAKAIEALKATIDEERRQAGAARLIAEAANARHAEAEKRADDIAAEIDEYVRRLAEQPPRQGCDCGLSAHDVERLRHIAGPSRASSSANPPRSPADRPRAGAGDPNGR